MRTLLLILGVLVASVASASTFLEVNVITSNLSTGIILLSVVSIILIVLRAVKPLVFQKPDDTIHYPITQQQLDNLDSKDWLITRRAVWVTIILISVALLTGIVVILF